jgi:hypothetical protein
MAVILVTFHGFQFAQIANFPKLDISVIGVRKGQILISWPC